MLSLAQQTGGTAEVRSLLSGERAISARRRSNSRTLTS